jgi:hypothetical protein
VQPATDPNAADVFYRLNHGNRPPLTVNALLTRLRAPLLLLWGMRDPWITMARVSEPDPLVYLVASRSYCLCFCCYNSVVSHY